MTIFSVESKLLRATPEGVVYSYSIFGGVPGEFRLGADGTWDIVRPAAGETDRGHAAQRGLWSVLREHRRGGAYPDVASWVS